VTKYIPIVCIHNHIISLRGENMTHDSSLTPPLFIDMPVPSQESEQWAHYVYL